MLHTFLIIVHILVCIVLATVVLLQSSKGGGLAGAFGGAGGAPQQLLGSRGMTTLLHKLTVYLAVAFFLTSLLLFLTQDSGRARTSGVVSEAARQGEVAVPTQAAPLDNADLQTTPAPTETTNDDANKQSDAGNKQNDAGDKQNDAGDK